MTRLPLLDNTDIPLVLLGGTLCDAALWQPVLQRLNLTATMCITPCGADSAPETAQRLLRALPPRFRLAGFSLGAIVALQMVADAPQRLDGVALLSVNPLADAPENADSRREAVRQAQAQGIGAWLTHHLWPRYVAPHRLDNASLHHTIISMAQNFTPEAFAGQTEIAITRRDNRAALASFAGPILMMNGAADVICTPRHHQALQECVPRARWLTVNHSGHFLPLEAPDEVARALHQWLTESPSCETTV